MSDPHCEGPVGHKVIREELQRIKHEFIECMIESCEELKRRDQHGTVLSSSRKVATEFVLRSLSDLIESFPEERFYIKDQHKWHLIDNKNNEKYLPYKFDDSTQNNLKEICDLLNAGDKALNKESAPQPKSK